MAAKDLRRLALPVLVWVAFLAMTAIWFRLSSPGAKEDSAPDVVGWLAVMNIWTRVILGGHLIIGYILAGALVLEDPLVGTNQFWMTRPLATGRLVAAKLLAAALIFVVAPAIALGVVWLGSGFTWQEMRPSFSDYAGGQVFVTMIALAAASLARNLVQFLFYTGGLVAGCCLVVIALGWISMNSLLIDSGSVLSPALLMLVAAVLIQRYVKRHLAPTWVTCCVAFFAAVSIGVVAPSRAEFFPSRLTSGKRDKANPGVTLTVKRTSLNVYSAMPIQASLWLALSPSMTPDGGYYAPAEGLAKMSLPDGVALDFSLRRVSGWGRAVAEAAAVGKTAPTVNWYVHGMADRATPAVGEARVTGYLDVWVVMPRVLGELPMRIGGEFSQGASRSRVIAMNSSPDFASLAIIEEHEAKVSSVDEPGPALRRPGMWRSRGSAGHRDSFVLVNVARGQTKAISYDEVGETEIYGHVTRFRRLYLPLLREGDDWRRDAVLVKVRLERHGSFRQDFETHAPVTRPPPRR